ncbi:hypothetical protein [Streptomyces sp. NPDC086519]|uniref:hypothetical protein n=1 Tax=Streptomyces sp. NPDC086519 TaxID=3154863 RepID=UPI00341AA3D9
MTVLVATREGDRRCTRDRVHPHPAARGRAPEGAEGARPKPAASGSPLWSFELWSFEGVQSAGPRG